MVDLAQRGLFRHSRTNSETQIKPFYYSERRRQIDGGAVVDECRYALNGSSPQLRDEC